MTLPYTSMVDGLLELGVPREKAEATARAALGLPAPVEPTKDDRIAEKEEQSEVVKQFGGFNFHVYNLSQARASKQTPGLPDLWCVHRVLGVAFWWETKRQVGGEHSPAQLDFAEECHRTKTGYGTGDRYAAADYLVALGIAERIGESLHPTHAYLAACRAAEAAKPHTPDPTHQEQP